MRLRAIENGTFLLLVVLTTISFVLLLRGFLQPVFWAAVLGILFQPVQRRWLAAVGQRLVLATVLNLFTIVVIVILPLFLVGMAVGREAISLYERIARGDIDPQVPVRWLRDRLPDLSEELALLDLDVDTIEQGLSDAVFSVSRFVASQSLAIGQDALRIVALSFLTLYILFFFLRDGHRIMDGVVRHLPLGDARERKLFARFAQVSRATIKGTLVVGIVQGGLGGLLFWTMGLSAPVLWGVLMTVLSMLPAVGASLVWLPAAIFLIATGSWIKGLILIAVGTLVIGTVDNVLRPLLVGRETQLPDYLILLSTLGGLSVFGIAGFVLGPVIAALFITVWEMFAEEYVPLAQERVTLLEPQDTDGSDPPPG